MADTMEETDEGESFVPYPMSCFRVPYADWKEYALSENERIGYSCEGSWDDWEDWLAWYEGETADSSEDVEEIAASGEEEGEAGRARTRRGERDPFEGVDERLAARQEKPAPVDERLNARMKKLRETNVLLAKQLLKERQERENASTLNEEAIARAAEKAVSAALAKLREEMKENTREEEKPEGSFEALVDSMRRMSKAASGVGIRGTFGVARPLDDDPNDLEDFEDIKRKLRDLGYGNKIFELRGDYACGTSYILMRNMLREIELLRKLLTGR